MGKKAVITVVALIVVAIAIVSLWGNVWPVLALAMLVVVLFFGSMKSIDDSVKANPDLSLLDGAEVVALRKAEMAAKNTTVIDITPAIANPGHLTTAIEAPADSAEEED